MRELKRLVPKHYWIHLGHKRIPKLKTPLLTILMKKMANTKFTKRALELFVSTIIHTKLMYKEVHVSDVFKRLMNLYGISDKDYKSLERLNKRIE